MKKFIDGSVVIFSITTAFVLVLAFGYTVGWSATESPATLWIATGVLGLFTILSFAADEVYKRGTRDEYERTKKLDSIDQKEDEQ